ncbi:helix-turn-helix domain-containing protein [Martelella lutilitoris]|uniref:Helix-turn-helix domain-containing protein n=1 Tax=Martelella lutilitoris TaxID=2583532 RepID=A0A7T7KMC2_9HYPH|nr:MULTISPECIES: helix-turn-helix domain-containing protein [Martelella]AMM83498.1 ArsR family transcriptional regulator [Martelella sp. AD-3]QQM31398.1 helix-turn-helix domain-containing protein [Martelella lutilitoris]
MPRNFLVVDPERDMNVIKGLAAPARIAVLKLLRRKGPLNVKEIGELLKLPQSTVSLSVQLLEEAGLIHTESQRARKGNQKVCTSIYDEVLIVFADAAEERRRDGIEVSMPVGLYTAFDVSAPCGLCTNEGIIGLLDVPDSFLDPARMKAGLIWFTRGKVEYQFPNNARLDNRGVEELEFSLELSSEMPGTNPDWPSDITIGINGIDIGQWTSPGDFGDRRGVFTPDWWKLKGSQYGMLKRFRVTGSGAYVDGVRMSDVRLADLGLERHHSIRLSISVHEDARHPGGVNIFGKGFGNYDQDIVLRIATK